MNILLIILLVATSVCSIALVLLNNSEVSVNLLFSNLESMNLGLLLVTATALGVLIGILLALLMFRVLQNKWEISRLKKELNLVQSQLTEANVKLAQQAEQAKQVQLQTTEEPIVPVVPVVDANKPSEF